MGQIWKCRLNATFTKLFLQYLHQRGSLEYCWYEGVYLDIHSPISLCRQHHPGKQNNITSLAFADPYICQRYFYSMGKGKQIQGAFLGTCRMFLPLSFHLTNLNYYPFIMTPTIPSEMELVISHHIPSLLIYYRFLTNEVL